MLKNVLVTLKSNSILPNRSDIPTKELSKRVANYMHAYTLYSAVRPFGATIMLGSWTKDHGSEVPLSAV